MRLQGTVCQATLSLCCPPGMQLGTRGLNRPHSPRLLLCTGWPLAASHHVLPLSTDISATLCQVPRIKEALNRGGASGEKEPTDQQHSRQLRLPSLPLDCYECILLDAQHDAQSTQVPVASRTEHCFRNSTLSALPALQGSSTSTCSGQHLLFVCL